MSSTMHKTSSSSQTAKEQVKFAGAICCPQNLTEETCCACRRPTCFWSLPRDACAVPCKDGAQDVGCKWNEAVTSLELRVVAVASDKPRAASADSGCPSKTLQTTRSTVACLSCKHDRAFMAGQVKMLTLTTVSGLRGALGQHSCWQQRA